MAIYTRSALKTAIAGRIHSKAGILASINATANNAVRAVISKVDLRSMKRKSTLAPNLFNLVYQYTCPTDMKGVKIIGLQPQTGLRDLFNQWELTSEEEFDRRKQTNFNLLAFSDRDLTRRLLISANLEQQALTINNFDSLTAGGSWVLFGDGTNLSIDTDQFIEGSGSLKFDISAAGGTTAGVKCANLSTFDLTNYKSAGSIFVWAWITSATNLTNYILKVGNSASNNYQMTATSTNEGLAFSAGWNLLRFDFSGKTTNGTVTDTTCNYAELYMTKTAGKISETDYRFDFLVARKGTIYNLIYYTKYAWQSSAGTYKVDSTDDGDYLNCDTEEFDMFVESFVEQAAMEARETDDALAAKSKLKELIKDYRKQYKGEALQLQDTYYNF